MGYSDHKISIGQTDLLDFINSLAEGKFLIPSFQRYFIWDPERIIKLWDSIYHHFPIGSILYWKTPIRLKIHRKLGNFTISPNGRNPHRLHSYILDGQQRATSLFVSYFGGQGQVRENAGFDYTLYFDAVKAGFFFAGDFYKHKWETDPAFLIRLKDVPGLEADYSGKLAGTPGFNKTVENNIQQLQSMFRDYKIPLICLRGFDIAGVCQIYERMNQGGVRLENMEIMIARNFQNNPTIIEEDFPV